MDKLKDKYEFGRCKKCFKPDKPLKNGYCIDCEIKLPDCFDNLFDSFKDNSHRV